MCPYYVPSNKPGTLYLCDSEDLHGCRTKPTPEERLDLCSREAYVKCPVFRFLRREPTRRFDVGGRG